MHNTHRIPKQAFRSLPEPNKESDLQKIVVNYFFRFIAQKHPTAVLIVNPFSEMKMTVQQRSKAHSQGWRSGQPDIVIVCKKGDHSGLALELKTLKSNPFKKNGELRKSEHLTNQQNELERYRDNQFISSFSVGLIDTLDRLDDYFN